MQATTSPEMQHNGTKVVLGGLFFQLALFSFFIWNIIIFDKRNTREPTPLSLNGKLPDWKRRIWALYMASFCILVRNIVRIAEYIQGPNGVVASNEVFIYLFDAFLIWSAMAVFIVSHPGKLAQRVKKEEIALQDRHQPLLAEA